MRRSPGLVTLTLAAATLAAVGLALPTGAAAVGATPQTTAAVAVAAHSPVATPPMGWNSWDAYGCNNGEQNMEAVARFLHQSGLERDGYTYVNADGCYDDLEGLDSPNTYGVDAPTAQDPETCGAVNGRLPDGRIFVNPYAFPPTRPCADDGFARTSDYVHSLGLKFGTYLDASNNWNCEEIPGSYGFDTIDARSLAAWGVDYVKADWGCNDATVPPGSNAPAGYTGIDAAPGNQGFGGPTFATNPAYTGSQESTQATMYTALSAAVRGVKRPIVFSVAGAGTVDSATWGRPLGQLVRPTGDANANFTATGRHAAGSVVGIVNADAQTYDASTAPGHWVDPDPMEIGNGSLTLAEDESEMSMFAEMTQPLLISTNLCASDCGPDTAPATAAQLAQDVEVFGNKQVIAIDQDALASPAHIVGTFDGTHLIMTKPLADGSVAVTLFNESTAGAATMSTTAAAVGLPAAQQYKVEDLWAGTSTTSTGAISATVAPTATVMFRIVPQGRSSERTVVASTGASGAPAARTASAVDPAAYDSPANLLSVSCGTPSLCTGVDNFGRVVSFDPSAPNRSRAVTIAAGRSLVSISCPAGAGQCTALDSGGTAYTFRPSLAGVGPVSTRRVDAGGQPTALTCVTSSRCVAVDGKGDEITFDPHPWTRTRPTVVAVDPSIYLGAVSCAAANQCTAVGGGGNGGDSEVTFDPTTGSVNATGVLAVDPATGNGATSVSCPATTQCTVVDGSGNEVTFDPTTGTVDAAGVAPLEGDVASGLGVMTSVACATTARCTAVDASGNAVSFAPATGAVTTTAGAVDPTGGGLESVACPADGSQCVAVDLDGGAATFSASSGAASGVTVVDPRHH